MIFFKKKLIIILILFFYIKAENNITLLPYLNTTKALNFIKKYLPDNPVVIEAGAYNGEDTERMSKLWPNGKIHSFEPVPVIFKWLTDRTKKYKNVARYNLALSDKIGFAEFTLSETPDKPGVPYGSGSLLQVKEHVNYYPYIFKDKTTVETITLDAWSKKFNIPRVDLLWLDMQGFELNTLMASKSLLKNVKAIFTEANFIEAYEGQYLYNDIKNWLENNGFKLIARDAYHSKSKWFCNLFFIRNDKNK